jgi:peptidoglycan hydrolase-like protein with peptidoglycan-binding domain
MTISIDPLTRRNAVLRLLSLFILTIVLSGCATTQMKSQNEQIESRITDLEKNLQAKDAEIVDLQYQVKDLSSKVDSSKGTDFESSSSFSESSRSSKASEGTSKAQIIRVSASAEKIQRALKSAGVYTGPIDGKVGPGTKEAIIEFQKSHGLKADGVLGKKTWEELKTYLK